MATARPMRPRQLAGPGITGSETDTPMYHLDVDRDQLDDLVAEPVKYLASVGLGPKQGIAPGGTMNVSVGQRDLRWTDGDWEQVSDAEPVTAWCCFVVGDETICHNH